MQSAIAPLLILGSSMFVLRKNIEHKFEGVRASELSTPKGRGSDFVREKKFRAWDAANKKWLAAGGWWIKPDGQIRVGARIENETDLADVSTAVGRFILVQYTGLKDKNGVEIYEGDILKRDHPNLGSTGRFSVRWNEKQLRYNQLRSQDGRTLRTLRVVGNIYENPTPTGVVDE